MSAYSYSVDKQIKIIDNAINQAVKIGYRIRPCPFVDFRFRICDPMGAVMMFNHSALSKLFSKGFARGFDRESPLLMTLEEMQGYVLGKQYRQFFEQKNSN